jgi:Leucine-rich repeat (LRR) protein
VPVTGSRLAGEAALVKAVESNTDKLDLTGYPLDDTDLAGLLDRIARELPALKILDLSLARISQLPDAIGQLTNLTHLYLGGSQPGSTE